MRDIEQIRAAVRTLHQGAVTDHDLERIGVTADELDRLVADDLYREALLRERNDCDHCHAEQLVLDDDSDEQQTSVLGLGF